MDRLIGSWSERWGVKWSGPIGNQLRQSGDVRKFPAQAQISKGKWQMGEMLKKMKPTRSSAKKQRQ